MLQPELLTQRQRSAQPPDDPLPILMVIFLAILLPDRKSTSNNRGILLRHKDPIGSLEYLSTKCSYLCQIKMSMYDHTILVTRLGY